MSDEANRPGQVSATPEGGPIDEGPPANEPGAGQVLSTPEAAPLDDEELVPPTWQEHMRGPILGTDGLPLEQERETASPAAAPAAAREEDVGGSGAPDRSTQDDEELRKWPPYTGKPVSEVRWEALRYAAPVVAQAEKLTIKAIDLSGRGLTKLARYLESRRQERDTGNDR